MGVREWPSEWQGLHGKHTAAHACVSSKHPSVMHLHAQAYVPLAEMFNYVSTLRGMTKGRANYRSVAASLCVSCVVCRVCVSGGGG
jgi:hypothetical protein